MAWTVLIVSGVLETVWAIALDRSSGFSRLVPSVVFVVAIRLVTALIQVTKPTIPVGVSTQSALIIDTPGQDLVVLS